MRSAVLLLAAAVLLLHVASSLKICAFNVQSFGEAKVNNKRVMGILLKVLYRKCWTKPATSDNRMESKSHLFFPCMSDPFPVWLVSAAGSQRLERRSCSSSGEGSEQVHRVLGFTSSGVTEAGQHMFLWFKLRQSQHVLVCGEWAAGQEELQGAVRLHLQVKRTKR